MPQREASRAPEAPGRASGSRGVRRAPADLTKLIPCGPAARLARSEVAAEMHQASGLSSEDVRALVYRAAAESIEGGAAAILRPEKRRAIVDLATSKGLRPFDANLVIAIAQDEARRGEGARTTATGDAAPALLGAIPPAARAREWTAGRILAIALGLAIAMLGGFVSWMRQG